MKFVLFLNSLFLFFCVEMFYAQSFFIQGRYSLISYFLTVLTGVPIDDLVKCDYYECDYKTIRFTISIFIIAFVGVASYRVGVYRFVTMVKNRTPLSFPLFILCTALVTSIGIWYLWENGFYSHSLFFAFPLEVVGFIIYIFIENIYLKKESIGDISRKITCFIMSFCSFFLLFLCIYYEIKLSYYVINLIKWIEFDTLDSFMLLVNLSLIFSSFLVYMLVRISIRVYRALYENMQATDIKAYYRQILNIIFGAFIGLYMARFISVYIIFIFFDYSASFFDVTLYALNASNFFKYLPSSLNTLGFIAPYFPAFAIFMTFGGGYLVYKRFRKKKEIVKKPKDWGLMGIKIILQTTIIISGLTLFFSVIQILDDFIEAVYSNDWNYFSFNTFLSCIVMFVASSMVFSICLKAYRSKETTIEQVQNFCFQVFRIAAFAFIGFYIARFILGHIVVFAIYESYSFEQSLNVLNILHPFKDAKYLSPLWEFVTHMMGLLGGFYAYKHPKERKKGTSIQERGRMDREEKAKYEEALKDF